MFTVFVGSKNQATSLVKRHNATVKERLLRVFG